MLGEEDIPPTFAECLKCKQMYFNALMCPTCNEVNVNVRPNFYVNTNKKKQYSFKCELQAGEEELGIKDQTASRDDNPLIQTLDANPGICINNKSEMVDETSDFLYHDEVSLDKFLSRPVLIKSYTWTENSVINQSFFPWYEYLNTTIIKNKIQNYFFGSMTLHIKVVVNASPFYYGAALLSYRPVPDLSGGVIDDTAGDDILNNAYSQRPHIWIYPQTSQGGSMELPFIYNYNAVDLTSGASVQALGSMNLRALTVLDNANSVSGTGATIRIYAHASNVKLGGPTAKAVLQSGVISGPASAVANISKSLANVPVIGKWAKATSIGASAVSGIASLFGFTDVPVIRDVEPLKNLPFHSLTSAHIGEPVTKLTLDPKNEVSIDTSIIGAHTDDELTISKFIDRYAVVGVATWSATATPDSFLWSSRVQPTTINSETIPNNGAYRIQCTPMGLTSVLFKYWRGSITYKITAIASKFHRGRYVISWDPNGSNSSVTSYVGTCFTKVVDIAEETEIEVTIPFMQPQPFNRCNDNYSASQGVTPLSNLGGESNGVMNIQVFTQQTSPVATSPIYLIVSVKGGPDLEFALPRAIRANLSPFQYQSSELDMDSRSSLYLTQKEKSVDASRYLISFGEPYKSLRSLMRRATLCYADVIPYPTTTGDTLINYLAIRPTYPVSPGFDPNGFGVANKFAAGTAPYNWVNYSPIDFISQCFVGRRGSIIHHININAGKTPMGYLATSYAATSRSSSLWNGSSAITSSSSASYLTKATLGVLDNGASGADMTTGFVMPAMSVQVPHNSPSRFMNTQPSKTMLGTAQDATDLMTLKVTYTSRDAAMTQLVDYIQIGTDYSVSFFLNVPTLYYYYSLPVAP